MTDDDETRKPSWIRKRFPIRYLYLRTGDDVRAVALKPWHQFVGTCGIAALALWTVVASTGFALDLMQIGGADRAIEVCDRLREELPLLLAVETRLAARKATLEAAGEGARGPRPSGRQRVSGGRKPQKESDPAPWVPGMPFETAGKAGRRSRRRIKPAS